MNEERFIKLTQIDGRSIWVNAHYLVTVEQRKGSGALVVPLGDGMDYEVRESPEVVISLCCGESAEKTVAMAPTNSIERAASPVLDARDEVAESPSSSPEKVVVPVEPSPSSSEVKEEIVASESISTAATKKPARKTRTSKTSATKTRKTSTKTSKTATAEEAPVQDLPKDPDPVPVLRSVAPVERDSVSQQDRSVEIFRKVAKMACRSRNRLLNTLKSQFSLSEEKSQELMSLWVDRGHIAIDGNGHVEWNK